MRSTTKARLVTGVFALSLILAACGGDDDGDGGNGGDGGATGATNGGATGETTGGGGGENEIVIQGFTFQPSTITVSGPTEFTVTNEDSAPHTFTLDDESVDVELAGGATETVTIDVSESIGFFCRIHPNMTGTVEVA
jgi:plastocyanin